MTTENPAKPTDVDKALLGTATYRSLGEQKLSPQEERFEKGRRTIGLFLAPLLTVVFLVLPIDIPREQQVLAAVLLGVIVLWISEAVPIPIGGLLGVAVAVFLGVAPVDDVLGPFGSSTIFTFIGAFILAQAMLKHGVARRFAFRILSLPGVGTVHHRRDPRVRRDHLPAVGVRLQHRHGRDAAADGDRHPPVIAKLLQHRGDVEPDFDPQRLRVGAAIMLMLAYGASVGGLLTPVGSPPNLIGRGLIEEATGERISFVQWMAMALPICLLMFVLLAFILLRLNKPEIKRIDGVAEYVAEERAKLGSLSRAEKNTLIAFGVTVTLWILPGVVALIAGTESGAYEFVSDRLDEGVVAVFGASLLFLLPTDWKKREFTLRWSDAAEIDWGTIVLFGCGIIFGSLISDTGLAETIGTSVNDALGLSSSVRDHDLRGAAGDHRVGDDEQHRVGGGGGADHHPGGDGRRYQPVRAGTGGDVRGVVRLHAAGVDAAERDRLRLGRREDHHDDPVRDRVRHRGRDPDHHPAAADGQPPRVGRMTAQTIAVIPGDGIGAEVIDVGARGARRGGARHGIALSYTEFDWSCQRYESEGAMMPADGIETLRGFDAILLGAVGWPGVPDHVSLWGLLIPIRRAFRQYVNLRPIRVFDGVESPLRAPGEVDFVVVRENVEGEYSEIGGRMNRGFPDEMAVQESVFTRVGVSRIADYAFELARTRRRYVTSATKSNGIVHTMPFWDEVVAERAAQYPGRADGQRAHRRAGREVRAAAAAVRRGGGLKPVRRHPVRPRRGGRGIDRHRAVGQPGPDQGVPVDVRAGARLGARHRRPGRRQPDRRGVVGGDDARPPRPRRRRPTCWPRSSRRWRSRRPAQATWAAPRRRPR